MCIEMDSVKFPPCVIDRWAGGDLTWKTAKVPSLSSGQGNLVIQDAVTIIDCTFSVANQSIVFILSQK